MKLSTKAIESLTRVRNDDEFVAFLKARFEMYKDLAVTQQDSTLLRIIQGKAQEVKELLLLIEDSRDLLTKQRRD